MPRAFVVGNGPSLNLTNLNKLIGEVSFATNHIEKIYHLTDWRPTIYVRTEEASMLADSEWQESMDVHNALGCEMWVNDYYTGGDKSKANIKSCAHYKRHYNEPNCPHMHHLPLLCTFGSSVTVAIQIAMLKEYNPIYLVGCDLGSNMKHFSSEYRHGKEKENRYALLDAHEAHIIAARSGYPIFNATIGGELEVYPRVEFESLFP